MAGHAAQATADEPQGEAGAGPAAEPRPGPSWRRVTPPPTSRPDSPPRMTPAGRPVVVQPSLSHLLRPVPTPYNAPSLRELAAAALAHNQAHEVRQGAGVLHGEESRMAWYQLPPNSTSTATGPSTPSGAPSPHTPSPRLAGNIISPDDHWDEPPLPPFTPYLQVPVVGFPGRSIDPGFENFAYWRDVRTLLAPLSHEVVFARHYEILKLFHFLKSAIRVEYHRDRPLLLPYTSPGRSSAEGAYSIMAANLWDPSLHSTDYAGTPRPYQGGAVTRPRIRHYRNASGVLIQRVPLDRAGHEYTHINTIVLQALAGRFILGLDTADMRMYRGHFVADEDLDSVHHYMRTRGITPLTDLMPGSRPNFMLKAHFYIFEDRQVAMTPLLLLSMAEGEEDLPLFFDMGNFLIPPDELIVADVSHEVGPPPDDSPFYPPGAPPDQLVPRGIHSYPRPPSRSSRRDCDRDLLHAPRPEDLQGIEHHLESSDPASFKKPFKKRKEVFVSSASEILTTTDSAHSSDCSDLSEQEGSLASSGQKQASSTTKRTASNSFSPPCEKSPRLDSRVSLVLEDPAAPGELVVEVEEDLQVDAAACPITRGGICLLHSNSMNTSGYDTDGNGSLYMEMELRDQEAYMAEVGFLNKEDDEFLQQSIGPLASQVGNSLLADPSPLFSPITPLHPSPVVSPIIVDLDDDDKQKKPNVNVSNASFTPSEVDALLASSPIPIPASRQRSDELPVGSPPRKSPSPLATGRGPRTPPATTGGEAATSQCFHKQQQHLCDALCRYMTRREHVFLFGRPSIVGESPPEPGDAELDAFEATGGRGPSPPPEYSPPSGEALRRRSATVALLRALERIIELFRTQTLGD